MDPVPTTSHSGVQHESTGGQKQFGIDVLDGLLRFGRLYLVLEEEFDALPLILACAAAGKRTICYVPASGSLFPWESIMSAIIPGRQVRSAVSISGNRIMQLSEIVENFASSNEGSVLVLRPTFIARANEYKAHSKGVSLIFWGLPGSKFWPDMLEAVQQSQHTLLILNQREHLDANCQAFFTGFGSGFTAHPHHSDLNSFKPGSVLGSFRDTVQRTISRAQHSQNIQAIYEELLESPINDTGPLSFVTQSREERIDVVNRFVARVFLRGRTQDGSSRFPCNGQSLPMSDKAHLCCISHTDTPYTYGSLFRKVSTYEVTATSKKLHTIEEGLERFSNIGVQSGLCLVRGNPPDAASDNLPNFGQVKGDALIYWGLPAQHSFLWPEWLFQDQFAHTYLIIPPDQLATTGNPILAGNDFQEYPDSVMLNAEGDDSALYHFREKARLAFAGMSSGELKQLSHFYSPAYQPAYPVAEFIRKVIMRSDF
ncbi:hypothetical protein RSAG8_08233, partial [Rhizoctonia solani AG-8 WAC10335]